CFAHCFAAARAADSASAVCASTGDPASTDAPNTPTKSPLRTSRCMDPASPSRIPGRTFRPAPRMRKAGAAAPKVSGGRPDLDLEEDRPELARHEQAAGRLVPGDPVEHVRVGRPLVA